MRKLLLITLTLASLCFAQDTTRPKIMVHYMPWYQTPAIHGYWGWHWTMNHYNPETTYPNGNRKIASNYYPLTGPYDSSDKLILEYQTLLMKISGVDGVLVDWYGMEDYLDYGDINESTNLLFTAVEKAGLEFAIVYEDQTIKRMIDGGRIKSSDAISYGKTVMKYMQDTWFSRTPYLKLNDQPVLLTFGPQYYTSSSSWTSLFADLRVKPLFFTLDNRLAPAASGAYPWPPMWKSNSSGVLTQSALTSYLDQFYQKAAGFPYNVTSTFPGFHDIYQQAGVGTSYGYLDRMNGETFKLTFKRALDSNPDVIQVVTWNDYGEGTIVEPTDAFQYQYLEIIREYADSLNEGFVFQESDLSLPLTIYNFRKTHSGNASINSTLDRIYSYIISGQREEAIQAMDSLLVSTDVEDNNTLPASYSLGQNFPNPFNPSTTITFTIPEPGMVNLKVFNLLGQEIKTLVNKILPASENTISFDATDLSGGFYIYRLSVNDFTASKKMLVLK